MRRIYIRDLPCYINSSEEYRKKSLTKGDYFFEIPDGIRDGLADQLEGYIRFRGNVLSLGSIRTDLWPFRTVVRFLTEKHPSLEGILEETYETLEHSLKVWMVKNGYALTGIHHRLDADKPEIKNSDLLRFLKRFYEYQKNALDVPEQEKDIWDVDKLGFQVRNNPVHKIRKLNFTPIIQEKMRQETKQAAFVSIRYLSVATLHPMLRAVRRFSEYLAESYPEIDSYTQLTRDVVEDYLIYINTEVTGKQSFRTELNHLKSMLDTVSLCMDCPQIKSLFLPGDISERGRVTGYRVYSDQEIKMWNEAIVTMDEQIARALVIHELLGNRISETLTLTQDCLQVRAGKQKVCIFQVKRQRTVYKPANDDVAKLIEKSIAYTKEHYGDRKYVFVSSNDPDEPMSYKTIQYHLLKLIREKNLRNEFGELYGVGTHTFRHSMGQRLTQMHVDDKTIAMLLGHSGIGSVYRYRRFGSKALADETRQMRESMDDIIGQIAKEWKK